jgi:hypothetical protein
VLFPYTAAAAAEGKPTEPYVVRCSVAALGAAAALAAVYLLAGERLLALMPNGGNYLGYAIYMPLLTLVTAMTSCQVFHTNSEVSAGRFGFLAWFLPLHIVYAAALLLVRRAGHLDSLRETVAWFAAASAARLAMSALHCLLRRNARSASAPLPSRRPVGETVG